MAEVGGDLETLRNLHKGLDDGAQKAIEFKSTLDGHVNQAVWKGANADKFRQAWEEFKPHFDKLLHGPERRPRRRPHPAQQHRRCNRRGRAHLSLRND